MEEVDSEKVIFDEETKQAHCLSSLPSVVFDHCDGESSPADLARVARDRLNDEVTEEQVQEALAQLEERGLLTSPPLITISRRAMVRKSAAAFGAAAAGATLILTVDPPMALAVACTTTPCSRNTQCAGGTGCGTKTCTTCVANKCTCT
jgi:hypothetical protein